MEVFCRTQSSRAAFCSVVELFVAEATSVAEKTLLSLLLAVKKKGLFFSLMFFFQFPLLLISLRLLKVENLEIFFCHGVPFCRFRSAARVFLSFSFFSFLICFIVRSTLCLLLNLVVRQKWIGNSVATAFEAPAKAELCLNYCWLLILCLWLHCFHSRSFICGFWNDINLCSLRMPSRTKTFHASLVYKLTNSYPRLASSTFYSILRNLCFMNSWI